MKKLMLAVILVLLLFYFWQCAEKNPLDIHSSKQLLTLPQSHPLITASNLIDDNGNFTPGYLNGKIRSDRITLDWAASTDADFIYYKIIKDDNEVEKISNQSIITYTDSVGIVHNTYYEYKIANVVRNGMALIDTIVIKTPRFETPYFIGYQIMPVTYDVRLIWENTVESATSYEIFKAEHPDSTFTLIGTTDMGDTTLTDTQNTDLGELFYYKVYGGNDFEQPDTSAAYPILISYNMSRPTNVLADYDPISETVTITWSDNSTGEDGFKILRGATAGDLAQIATVPTNYEEYIDTDSEIFQTDSTYYYTVRAYNSQEQSESSEIASVVITEQSSMVEIGTGLYNWSYPLHTGYEDARTQIIYLASEINQSMVINNIALDVSVVPGQMMENFVIRMKHTALDSYTSDNFDNSGYTVCLNTNLMIASTGWIDIPLSVPFYYNGSSNLIIDISFDNNYWTYDGECESTILADLRTIIYQSDSYMGDPLYWASGIRIQAIPNIRLY